MVVLAAAETKTSKLSRIAIKNVGCVNEDYYRGAQPQKQDYAALAALGVKAVIDLEREGEADEQQMVESNGMKFFRCGMNTTDRPDSHTVGHF